MRYYIRGERTNWKAEARRKAWKTIKFPQHKGGVKNGEVSLRKTSVYLEHLPTSNTISTHRATSFLTIRIKWKRPL